MLRIGYFGDGAWARNAFLKIVNDTDFAIAFVVLRYGMPDLMLKDMAENQGIPCFTAENVNSMNFLQRLHSFSVDVNVSMSFDQILKHEIIFAAPKGFINCHAGALPFYRGRNILNWALINGETRFGVTVHYVDEGIDTGDIILQKFAPITPTDRYGDLLKKASVLCADVLYEALVLMKENRVHPIPQKNIHPVGFYCSARKNGDEYIDWSWSSERIYNFVRGIADPAPGARTFFEGCEFIIDCAEMIENAPIYLDKAGCIVGKTQKGIVVKTGDSTLMLTRILTDMRQKVDLRGFRIGQRFWQERDEMK